MVCAFAAPITPSWAAPTARAAAPAVPRKRRRPGPVSPGILLVSIDESPWLDGRVRPGTGPCRSLAISGICESHWDHHPFFEPLAAPVEYPGQCPGVPTREEKAVRQIPGRSQGDSLVRIESGDSNDRSQLRGGLSEQASWAFR